VPSFKRPGRTRCRSARTSRGSDGSLRLEVCWVLTRVGRMIVGMNNLVQRVALMIIACVVERRDGMPGVF